MKIRKITGARAAIIGVGAFAFAALAVTLHFRDDAAIDPDPFPQVPARATFTPADIARFENFEKAAAGYREIDRERRDNGTADFPFSEWEYLLAEEPEILADVAANAALLPAAEALIDGPIIELHRASLDVPFHTLASLRKAERIFGDAAFIAAKQGDFPRAYALLRRAQALGAIDGGELTMIDALGSVAITGLIHEKLVVLMAMDPDVERAHREGHAAFVVSARTVSPEQLAAGEVRFFKDSLASHRRSAPGAVPARASLTSSDRITAMGDALHDRWLDRNYLPKATVNKGQQRYLDWMNGLETPPPGWFAKNLGRNCGGQHVAAMVDNSINLFKNHLHRRPLADRLRLAVALHRLAHRELPTTLEALSPKYVPEETVAAFLADGGTYDPSTGTVNFRSLSGETVPLRQPDLDGARRAVEESRRQRTGAQVVTDDAP